VRHWYMIVATLHRSALASYGRDIITSGACAVTTQRFVKHRI